MIRQIKPVPRKFQVGDVVKFRRDYWRSKVGGNCEHYSVRVESLYEADFNGEVVSSIEPHKKIGDILYQGVFDAFELVD